MQDIQKSENDEIKEKKVLVYTTKGIEMFIGIDKRYKNFIIIKNFKSKFGFCTKLLTNKDINNSPFTLKINEVIKNEELKVIQEFNGFIPFSIFLEHNNNMINFIYETMFSLILMFDKSEFIDQFSTFIDTDVLWIDKNFNIKICWMTFLIKNDCFFDNTILKLNFDKFENIIQVFNFNKRRLQKRHNEIIIREKSDSEKINLNENFFIYNQSKYKKDTDIKYNNKITSMDRGVIKTCGTKKICIESKTGFCKTVKKKPKNYLGIKIILVKMFFPKETVNYKNLDCYLAKIKEIYLAKSEVLFLLTEKMVMVMEFILDIKKPNNIEITKQDFTSDFIEKYLEDLYNQFVLNENQINLDTKESDSNIIGNPFKEKGFNMTLFDTKSFKKGRFFVCQAVPNNNVKDKTTKINLDKILQIIELQNKQIDIMYQTLKDNKSTNRIIDAQLEALSLQANEMLTDLEKFEE